MSFDHELGVRDHELGVRGSQVPDQESEGEWAPEMPSSASTARIAVMPHHVGGMPMMQDPAQCFGEHVGRVDDPWEELKVNVIWERGSSNLSWTNPLFVPE